MNKTRIMIVEDEAVTGIYVKNIMTRRGYVVTSIEGSGEEAVKRAELDKPDIVLMDIKLSGNMDGIDAAKIILERCSIPVIFLTAQSDANILEKLNTNKPFNCLFKPYTEKELEKIISETLNIKPK
jgi:CheY-like chemotaxis protein